jgi:MFS transporter, putative metabolite transport protein
VGGSLQDLIDRAPLTAMQWRVWGLAAAGKFLEGMIVFTGGLSLPLLVDRFALMPWQAGWVASAALVGILVGALATGGLADRWGRRPLFIAEMALLALGLLLAALSSSVTGLLLALVLTGLALGADYPTAHLVIAESMPTAVRGRLVLAAFAFQALGVVTGTAMATLVLERCPGPMAWRWLQLLPLLPVVLVGWGRWGVPESGHWLLSRGQRLEAQAQLARLLEHPDLVLPPLAGGDPLAPGLTRWPGAWRQLLQPALLRATALASLPWFLQDLATYGVGLFTPLLLVDGLGDGSPARPTLVIDLGLLLGMAAAVALADRWGRIPLQITGFVGCAAALLLAALAHADAARPAHGALLLAGLLLFQVMTNLGPNAQTYLLAGEVFPTAVRGSGAGLAAAAGKLGAVLTALVGPPLLAHWGASPLLCVLAFTSLLGALVTWICRIETRGRALEAS